MALEEFLSSPHTPSSVKIGILTNMTRWMEPTIRINESQQSKITCSITTKAEILQTRIGWRHFIWGRIAIQWGNIISTHLDQQGIK
jgi:hypothetical protein